MTREIRHSFFINAPVDPIMDALMQEEHIRKWWTKEARVVNGKGTFGWSGYGWTVELEMQQDLATQQVLWKCTSSNMQNTNAWVGTSISFSVAAENDGTRVEFAQTGYRTSPCFEACEQGWAYFVGTSLKQYIETGKGIPYPEMQDTSAAQSGSVESASAMHTITPTIRPETSSDEEAIAQVTRRAFLNHPYSQQTEQFIISALRADQALSVSLVAEDAGRVVGHIAFSPVTISDGADGWYGLGPISVEPDLQRRGIGRSLMESGLAELRKLGANGCVLVGDPAFYSRFKFVNNPALVLEGVPPEFFLCLALGVSSASGNVHFHPAFQAKG